MTVTLPGRGVDGATVPIAPVLDADEREITGIRLRISADHPDVPESQIEAALRTALARTADAPVQTFRLVLAERDVRARLRAAGSRPHR